MGLRMKNFSIMGGSLKNPIFRGGVPEKPIYKGELPKKGGGGWTVSRFRGVGLAKEKGWCFWEGVDTLMHTSAFLKK